jgi:hypothetical protein
MKSVIGMIVVFVGVGIILYLDVFSLFAQSWMFSISLIWVAIMLLIAVFTFGLPLKKKKGGNHE